MAGDTKRGTFIAMDRFGNMYYENLEEELPCTQQPFEWYIRVLICEQYEVDGWTTKTRSLMRTWLQHLPR